LLSAIEDRQHTVRSWAVGALVEIDPTTAPRVIPAIITLMRERENHDQALGALRRLGPESARLLLEYLGDPEEHVRGAIVSALCDYKVDATPVLAAGLRHPNPRVRDVLSERLGGHARTLLSEPLCYTAFVRALENAALVLTDSGGVQEECTALGKPVLVLREHTERPEAVEAGVAEVVGTDAQAIVEAASRLLGGPSPGEMKRASDAFGDGHAAERILAALASATARENNC